ncbi:MAG: hypothetical protein HRU34_19140 [Richelia sp.]|nr:hypothetical protein [Richelia sp.]
MSSANANALWGVLEGHRQKKLTQLGNASPVAGTLVGHKNGDLSIKEVK